MNEKFEEKIDKIHNKYLKLGLTVFCAGTALILVYYLVHNVPTIKNGVDRINDILMPFYIGIVMAYLLCPIYNGTLKHLYRFNKGKFKSFLKDYRFSRFVATVVSIVVLIAIIVGFCWMIIPDLVDSIVGLIMGIPDTVDKVVSWIKENVEQNPELVNLLQGRLENLSDNIMKWAQEKLLPGAESIFAQISSRLIGTIGTIVDIFVALIICVYILNSKEMFAAQSKKMIFALFSKERADKIFEFGHIANATFGGFINGKIIDSIIIGIICFIVMSIMKLPLTMLISVTIGITNIIPFFGPFIGAIPSLIILLLIDPIASLKFLVMIIILQQVDGNIIGPKILGKATKLQSFWVMFAIIVGGGLFGFLGMILGVPIFAIFYVYMSRLINHRLSDKNLPVETTIYEDLSRYDINKEDVFGKKSQGKIDCSGGAVSERKKTH